MVEHWSGLLGTRSVHESGLINPLLRVNKRIIQVLLRSLYKYICTLLLQRGEASVLLSILPIFDLFLFF